MIKLITIDGEYKGVPLYHPGLVYEPTERVMNMATLWASTIRNSGTAKKYLKSVQAFCRHYERRIGDKEKAAEILPQFERYVHRDDIKLWMADRVKRRNQEGVEAPKDSTIEGEAVDVGRFLDWAKTELRKSDIDIPYVESEKKVKVIHLKKDKNFLAGVKDTIKVEQADHGLHISGKPTPGIRPKVMAKRIQKNGHAYLTDNEVRIFLTSFPDPVWTFAGLTAYHTGLRTHEVLAVPRFAPYKEKGDFFTADPTLLRQLKAKGKKEIKLEVYGKGEKVRDVIFDIEEWLYIMELYEPYYQERKKIFEAKAGRKLEHHELWLSKPSKKAKKMVQYCLPGDQAHYDKYLQPLRSAVGYVKDKYNLVEEFGHQVDFYCLRHTYATNVISKAFKKHPDLREKAERNPDLLLKDIRIRTFLEQQLGHEDFETTLKHYIDNVVATQSLSFPSVVELIDCIREESPNFLSNL